MPDNNQVAPTTRLRGARWAVITWVSSAVLMTATPAAAECIQLDAWPPFGPAAEEAHRLAIVRVAKILDRTGTYPTKFSIDVVENIKGHTPDRLVLEGVRTDGECVASWLVVEPGDTVALAFGPDQSIHGPVSAVAFVDQTVPNLGRPMPGMTRLSTQEVRRFGDLPDTDAHSASRSASQHQPAILAAVSLASGLLAFAYLSRRRPRRRS